MTLLAELAAGSVAVPLPGGGRTAERWEWLMAAARHGDVSTARLAEAHLDAVAILHEAGRGPHPGSLYGVWASVSTPEPSLTDGHLAGTKRFCSGVGIVDRALVTVGAGDESLLVDVAVPAEQDDAALRWRTPALRDTSTGDVDLTGADYEVVESAAWYFHRPGFWHGACGPAACWAGAAIGLVDAAVELVDDDPHRLAHVGAMVGARWTMTALLCRAGAEIDESPHNRSAAELRARSLRNAVERISTDTADRFSRAFGPRPFVSDLGTAQRHADLHLYLRQHHAERELGALASLATAARAV